MTKRPAVKDIWTAARRGGEMSVYVWMMENHAELLRELPRYRTAWDGLAKRLSELGLTNSRGRPISAATARKTWQRVRKEVEARSGAEGVPAVAARRAPEKLPQPSQPPEPVAPRPNVTLTFARPADPTVPPKDDGSKLPKPVDRKGS